MAQLASKVKDHFLNPRNVGKIDDADAAGKAGDPARGSGVRVFLKLAPGGSVGRMTYQIINNAPAIAPASAFSEMIAGMSTDEALGVTREAIMAFLDCDEATARNLRFDVLSAFANAIAVLQGDESAADPLAVTPHPPGMGTPPGAADVSPQGSAGPDSEKGAPTAVGGRPKLMVMRLIQDVLDSEIRPAVGMDGGDVELVDVDDRRVFLRLHGHCVGCSSSNTTMRFFVEDRLRELIDPGIEVIDVTEFKGDLHAPPGFFPPPGA